MTRLQSSSITIGAGLLLLASLFPPWLHTFQAPGISQVRRPAGYHLLVTPPPPAQDNLRFGVALDLQRLLIEYLIIVVGSGTLFILGRGRTR